MNDSAASGQAKGAVWIYRPEIDGLRSIAVLSVLMFHFDRSILGGGFVGVDVFFVISGFLITSILLNDIERGELSIPRFYQRRIARIAPAFFVVLVATLGAAFFIYSAQDFAFLGTNAFAAAISAINIKLLTEGDYFQTSSDAQPLLHYWSLAVEEQFYLIFPIYLFLITRYSKRPLAITLAVSALSFVGCVVLTQIKPTYAFYLLPTRAWELLIGASLALHRRGAPASGGASLAGWCGLGLLAASFLVIKEGDNFPGWIAALPVAGTVLVLWSVINTSGRLGALLAHPWMVFIGKRSYSLYLWHWPIFSFSDYYFYSSNSVFRSTFKITICVAATLLTYRFVERPMRAYLNGSRRPFLAIASFVIAVAAVCVVSREIRVRNYLDLGPRQIAAGGVTINGGSSGTVVLVGDSQAAMYGYELASLARAHRFTLTVFSAAATNELPDEPNTQWPEIERFIIHHRPAVVVLAERWSDKLGHDGQSLRKALAIIKPLVGRVVLITQAPFLPNTATRDAIRAGGKPPFFEPSNEREARARASALVNSLAGDRIVVVNAVDALSDASGAIKLIAADGRFTYHDRGHLSDSGTALVRPLIEPVLIEALPAR